ncbi:hypothetical protein IWX49DRAFT_551649 [Phyllosticta citricarpa]
MTRVAFLSLLTYLNQPNLAILDLARQPTAHPVNKPPLSVAPNVLLSATDSRPYRCAFFSAKSAVCLPRLQLLTTACNQEQPRHSALHVPADRDDDAHNLA